MKTQEQIQLINDTINKTKENLKSSSKFYFLGRTDCYDELYSLHDFLKLSRKHAIQH